MARILVIDDDEAVGIRMRRLLSSAGFETRYHRGPFGTLNVIREFHCDLILLDLNMPKLDGTSIVRMIRDTFLSNRICVVLFSNMESGTLKRLATAIGAHDAISKSVEDADIVAQIEGILAKRGVDRQKPHAKGRVG